MNDNPFGERYNLLLYYWVWFGALVNFVHQNERMSEWLNEWWMNKWISLEWMNEWMSLEWMNRWMVNIHSHTSWWKRPPPPIVDIYGNHHDGGGGSDRGAKGGGRGECYTILFF